MMNIVLVRWRQINNSKPENVLGGSLIHMNMCNLSMLGNYYEISCAKKSRLK